MSLVVLAVTHLEAGPAEAGRIARVLPVGNSSTLAFLATFHFVSTRVGLASGMLGGYLAAVTVLLIVERNVWIKGFICRRTRHARAILASRIVPLRLVIGARYRGTLMASNAHSPRAPRYMVPDRSRHRVRFAPRVETLAW
jgi:hypothetical protein